MLKFIFYNSYQNSPVGFQSASFILGQSRLQPITAQYPGTPESKELLFNSGTAFALGKSAEHDIRYFLYKGIEVSEAAGKRWFINVVVEADAESAQQFDCFTAGILLCQSAFLQGISEWFVSTPESALSYAILPEAVQNSVLSLTQSVPADNAFLQTPHPVVRSFKKMLQELYAGDYKNVLCLVAYPSVAYFLKQCPSFKGVKVKYIFQKEEFESLLAQKIPDEKETEKQESFPIGDADAAETDSNRFDYENAYRFVYSKLKETNPKVLLAGAIGVGTGLVLGAIAIKGFIKGGTKK